MKATIRHPKPEAIVTVEMTETEARVLKTLLWHVDDHNGSRAGRMMRELASTLQDDAGLKTLDTRCRVRVGSQYIGSDLIYLDDLLPD